MKTTICAFALYLLHQCGSAVAENTRVEIIAAVIAGEARGEGQAGMLAVAEVIRNRGGDPVRVVLKPRQFSCLNGTTIGRLVEEMRAQRGWAEARYAATLLLWSPYTLGDRTKGATHYHESGCRPHWAGRAQYLAHIGKHHFCKL